MDSWLSSEKIWQHLELSQYLCTGFRNLMWSEILRTWECILLHISIQSLSNSNGCLSTWCPRLMVFQSVIEKKKKMDEVSVGAAASTSVVDLSGDSHLQVETQDLTWLLIWIRMPKISHPQRLIYRMPCQRRTKWNSQFTQEQVTIWYHSWQWMQSHPITFHISV